MPYMQHYDKQFIPVKCNNLFWDSVMHPHHNLHAAYIVCVIHTTEQLLEFPTRSPPCFPGPFFSLLSAVFPPLLSSTFAFFEISYFACKSPCLLNSVFRLPIFWWLTFMHKDRNSEIKLNYCDLNSSSPPLSLSGFKFVQESRRQIGQYGVFAHCLMYKW